MIDCEFGLVTIICIFDTIFFCIMKQVLFNVLQYVVLTFSDRTKSQCDIYSVPALTESTMVVGFIYLRCSE